MSQYIKPNLEVYSGPFDSVDSNDSKLALEVSSNLGIVYDYFKKVFNRNSFDNKNAQVKAFIFEDVTGIAVIYKRTNLFGFSGGTPDNSTSVMKISPGLSLDCVAHEFTHGILNAQAGGEPQKNQLLFMRHWRTYLVKL